jgi:hypothetical protein
MWSVNSNGPEGVGSCVNLNQPRAIITRKPISDDWDQRGDTEHRLNKISYHLERVNQCLKRFIKIKSVFNECPGIKDIRDFLKKGRSTQLTRVNQCLKRFIKIKSVFNECPIRHRAIITRRPISDDWDQRGDTEHKRNKFSYHLARVNQCLKRFIKFKSAFNKCPGSKEIKFFFRKGRKTQWECLIDVSPKDSSVYNFR